MLHVIREACGVFRFNKPAWKKLMVQGMESDFSWDSSADRYASRFTTPHWAGKQQGSTAQ